MGSPRRSISFIGTHSSKVLSEQRARVYRLILCTTGSFYSIRIQCSLTLCLLDFQIAFVHCAVFIGNIRIYLFIVLRVGIGQHSFDDGRRRTCLFNGQ